MINFTLRVIFDFTNLLKSVNQGCLNTRTQYIMNIANHFSAVLFYSINTLAYRVNHSSAILLQGFLSKIADLPKSVKKLH